MPKFSIAAPDHSEQFGSESSSSSSSCRSEYTTTTSSTTWGPGALLGKFLLAFGKAILYAGENLVIRRRLSKIKAVFPHEDNGQTTDLEQVYDDILEVMRPGFYGKKLRKKAVRLILKQIAIGHTSHLIRGLMKWPTEEMRLILSEIIGFVHPKRVGSHNDNLAVVLADDIYRSRITLDFDARRMLEAYFCEKIASLATAPILRFIAQLSRMSSLTLRMIFDAESVDKLLHNYLCDFLPSLHPLQEKVGKSSRDILRSESNAALAKFQDHDISQIAVNKLRSNSPSGVPQYINIRSGRDVLREEHQSRQRPEIWRQMDKELILLRLRTIGQVMDPSSNMQDEIFVAYLDLLEFSSSDAYGCDARTDALHCLGDSINRAIYPPIEAIAQHSEDSVALFSGLIRSVLNSVQNLQANTESRSNAVAFQRDCGPICRFLEFIFDAACRDSLVREALRMAGVMVLLLAVLKVELRQFIHTHSSELQSREGTNISALVPSLRQLYIRPTWVHSLGTTVDKEWATVVWSSTLLGMFRVMKREKIDDDAVQHCICCIEEWSMFGTPCTGQSEGRIFKTSVDEQIPCCYTCPNW